MEKYISVKGNEHCQLVSLPCMGRVWLAMVRLIRPHRHAIPISVPSFVFHDSSFLIFLSYLPSKSDEITWIGAHR